MPPRPAGAGLSRKPCGLEGSCTPGPPALLSAPHTRQSWGCCVLPAASLAHLLQKRTPQREGWQGRRIRAFLKGPPAISPPGSWHRLYQALFLGRSWATPGRGPGWKQCSKGGWAAPPGGPELFLPIRTAAVCRDEEVDQPGWACSRSEGLCVVASQIWGKATGWSNRPFSALGCLPRWADPLLPLSQPERVIWLAGRLSWGQVEEAGQEASAHLARAASQVPGLCTAGCPPSLQGRGLLSALKGNCRLGRRLRFKTEALGAELPPLFLRTSQGPSLSQGRGDSQPPPTSPRSALEAEMTSWLCS